MALCPSCGNTKYKKLSFGGYLYQDTVMPLQKCAHCKLKYVSHNLTQAEIDEFYNRDEYFDSEYIGGAGGDYASNKLAMEEKADKVFRTLNRFKSTGKLLDTGCAGGFSLKVAHDTYGYDAYGAEVSKMMSQFAEKRGMKVCCGSTDAVPTSWGSFDAIYLGDVLEHVPTPNAFIQKIRARLSEGGVLVLEVPLSYNLTLSGLAIGFCNMLCGRFGYRYFLPAQHRASFIAKPPYHLLMFNCSSMDYFFWELQ